LLFIDCVDADAYGRKDCQKRRRRRRRRITCRALFQCSRQLYPGTSLYFQSWKNREKIGETSEGVRVGEITEGQWGELQ
jgi:hypothetical protein